MNTNKVLARNTAWNYVGFAANLATNLIMFPFVVHRLGDAAAGVWLLSGAVTEYMSLFGLGIVPSLAQRIAALSAQDDREGLSKAASSAAVILAGLGALLLVVLLPLAGGIVSLLKLSAALAPLALVAFRIAILGFALRMPLAAFQGILLGRQRQDRCNQLWIAMGLAKLIGAALVLSLGYGLVGLVTSEMVIHLLAGVLQVRWVYSEVPDLRLSWKLANREDGVHLLSFGSALLLVTVCGLIIEQTDRFVIAAFLPVAMVTYYAAAWKVYMLAYTLTTTLVGAVSPVAAHLYGGNDLDGLKLLFLRWTRYAASAGWALVFTLGFAGGFLLKVWMGRPFVSSLVVVQVLVGAFAVTAYNHVGSSVLIGKRRIGPLVTRYYAPQAILNLGLSIWLVRTMGNVGVALGTLLPAVILEYFFLDFVLKELRVSWREFLAGAVWPVAGSAVVSYLPLLFVYTQVDSASGVLPLAAAGCTGIYSLLVWRRLEMSEREQLAAYLQLVRSFRVRAIFSSRENPAEGDHRG